MTPDAFATDIARDDLLVLVDVLDRKVGTATKEEAHFGGLLHRAFSIQLVREGTDGPELLLTRRAEGKYHSGGLWTNSVCSHPRAGEELAEATARRMAEELGVVGVPLTELGSFVYRHDFGTGITEYELDHVFLGRWDGVPSPDPSECSEWRWVPAPEVMRMLLEEPQTLTVWFVNVAALVLDALEAPSSARDREA